MPNDMNFNFQKSNIYIVDASIDITGAFICTRNEARILKNKVDVVLVLPRNSRIKEKDLVDFKKVIRLPIVNIRKSIRSLITYLPALMIASWQLKRLMKEDECIRLQINDFYLMHGVCARLFGFNGLLVTWVRINPWRYGSFLSKIWLKLGYKYSNNIISVSRFIQEISPKSKKNKLIYDPVYIREVSQKTDNRMSGTDVRKLIYVGNYIEGKGQQYAIQAFTEIADKYHNVELHFYGGDMGLDKNRVFRQKLEDQAAATPHIKRIYFHDFIDDIGSVFKDAYVALNFSDSESFSLSCLEASYYGIPLIATKCGGPQEIVENEKTGYLVNVSDVDAMTKAIIKLLEDEILTKKMGKEGMRYVKEKFSEILFIKEINEVFHLNFEN